MPLNVGQLRALLANKNIPDDMLCGVTDHYGDFIAMDDIPRIADKRLAHQKKTGEIVLVFENINIGEEPD